MRHRRGVALLLALCTLSLAGALVAGSVYATAALRRGATRLRAVERARALAERAVLHAVATMAGTVQAGAPGVAAPLALDLAALRLAPDEQVALRVVPLLAGLHRVEGSARVGEGRLRVEQTAHALARLDTPIVRIAAAIDAAARVEAAADWRLQGGSVERCPPDSALAAIRLVDSTQLRWQGTPFDGGVLQDHRAGAAAALLAALRAGATVRLPHGSTVTPAPRDTAGRCLTADLHNWGTTQGGDAPCADHRPLVLAEGDLVLAGGEGQGVLLVTGRLTVTGPLRYSGLIVVGGRTSIHAPGTRLDGAIIAAGDLLLAGSGEITGSSCAVRDALDAAARWRVLPGWGWGAAQ